MGVFMRNWDSTDEQGKEACPADADLEDVKKIGKHLGILIYTVRAASAIEGTSILERLIGHDLLTRPSHLVRHSNPSRGTRERLMDLLGKSSGR